MAMKIASVAPTTDSAPFMPQAQVTICGARARQQPHAGRHRDAQQHADRHQRDRRRSAIRTVRENGIAQAMSGVTTPIDSSADARRSPSDGDRRSRRSESVARPAAQRGADAGAQQQREQRHRQRVHRVAEQQHEPLQHRHLDQHEAGAERAEVDEPRQPSAPGGRRPRRPAAPTTNSTTSAAEMPISVSSALRPLPNSIDRPNATWN